MQTIYKPRLDRVPVFNLLSVLEGKLLDEGEDSVDLISGEVVIALPQSRESLLFSQTDSVVICGHQPGSHSQGIGTQCELSGPVPDGASGGAAESGDPGPATFPPPVTLTGQYASSITPPDW